MMRIRVLKEGHVLDTVDAKWTINIAEIAREADKLLPHLGADGWEVVNEDDVAYLEQVSLAPDAACSLNECRPATPAYPPAAARPRQIRALLREAGELLERL